MVLVEGRCGVLSEALEGERLSVRLWFRTLESNSWLDIKVRQHYYTTVWKILCMSWTPTTCAQPVTFNWSGKLNVARQIFSFGGECWSFEIKPVTSETSWTDKQKRRLRRQWFCRENWPWDRRRPKCWATCEPNSCGTAGMTSISPVINRFCFFSIRLSLRKSLVIVSWAVELNWLLLLIVGKHPSC